MTSNEEYAAHQAMKKMRKSTTWRVRVLGGFIAIDRTFDSEREARDCPMIHVGQDYEIARLETIVSGPNELARYDVAKDPRYRIGEAATYYRTIIDTLEWITRPWSDPASAARWHELSSKEDANA